jgi:hypothetical protein
MVELKDGDWVKQLGQENYSVPFRRRVQAMTAKNLL